MESAILLIKNNYNSLTKSEQIIADYVLSNPNKVLSFSIDQLAIETYSSNSTISRFVKKLNIIDYKTFRVLLAHDVSFINRLENPDVGTNEMLDSIDESIAGLNLLKNLITEENIIVVTHLIHNASRVDFIGRGVSNLVAQDMHQKFMKVKAVTNSYVDASMQDTGASTLKKNDVVFFFSYSGDKDIIRTMQIAKSRQAKIVFITKYNGESNAQTYADVTIYLPANLASDQKLYYTSSRILMLSVVDLLYLNYIRIYQESIDNLYRVETFAHL